MPGSLRLLAACALVAGLAGAPPAHAADWRQAGLGALEGLVDLRASPHTDSGLVALREGEGWRALKRAEDGTLVDDGPAPFMGRLAPVGIIPDGRVGVSPVPPPSKDAPEAGRVPTAAWYEDGVGRYPHGALGDEIEAATLQVAYADRRILPYRLDENAVFEDLEPRIIDADGDGRHEVLAIRSTVETGAGLALYALDPENDRIREVARSEPVGQPNRWLNPAGVADYDGDGAPEIAAVLTPHIDGRLVHYAWDGTSETMTEERRLSGYSNHWNGSVALGLSATLDWNGDGRPNLLLPDAERRRLVVLAVVDGDLVELAGFEHESPVATSLALADIDLDGRNEVVYALADGSIHALSRTLGAETAGG